MDVWEGFFPTDNIQNELCTCECALSACSSHCTCNSCVCVLTDVWITSWYSCPRRSVRTFNICLAFSAHFLFPANREAFTAHSHMLALFLHHNKSFLFVWINQSNSSFPQAEWFYFSQHVCNEWVEALKKMPFVNFSISLCFSCCYL